MKSQPSPGQPDWDALIAQTQANTEAMEQMRRNVERVILLGKVTLAVYVIGALVVLALVIL